MAEVCTRERNNENQKVEAYVGSDTTGDIRQAHVVNLACCYLGRWHVFPVHTCYTMKLNISTKFAVTGGYKLSRICILVSTNRQ